MNRYLSHAEESDYEQARFEAKRALDVLDEMARLEGTAKTEDAPLLSQALRALARLARLATEGVR